MLSLFRMLPVFLWLFASFQPLSAQYAEQINVARNLFATFVHQNQIPGAAISVAVRGEIVWSHGIGLADLEQGVPVDPSKTLFRVGSVSKPFTAFVLARFVDLGKIDLDAPIQRYVPDFPIKKYSFTLRQLGGHLAGIRHYRGNEFENTRYFPSVREGLSLFLEDSLMHEPGTRYLYSSYGWNLLSLALENAAGKPFLDLVEEEVFQRIGMASTHADVNQQIIPYRARFYEKYKDRTTWIIRNANYVDNSYKWAGGGFLSTTEDLLRFAQAHSGNWFLSDRILRELFTPQRTKDGKSTDYGIGWESGTYLGEPWMGHSGGSVGGVTQLIIFPQKGVSVAVLTNLSPVDYQGVHRKIASLFFPQTIPAK